MKFLLTRRQAPASAESQDIFETRLNPVNQVCSKFCCHPVVCLRKRLIVSIVRGSRSCPAQLPCGQAAKNQCNQCAGPSNGFDQLTFSFVCVAVSCQRWSALMCLDLAAFLLLQRRWICRAACMRRSSLALS
jgi:hypothetical protein